MPEKATVKRAQRDKRAGKSASTQAGEFVREEMEHIREGKHGAKNAKQAIAIGLSKARRAGVDLPGKGSKSRPARKTKSRITLKKPSRKRSEAATRALRKKPRSAASHLALSRQAHKAARAKR